MFVPDLLTAFVDGTGRAAELRGDRRPLDVELGDVELVHLGREVAVARVRDVDAVEQVGVVVTAAAGGDAAGRPVVRDAGDQLEQPVVAAGERQLLVLLPV